MPASANCSGNLGESSQLATKAIVPSSGYDILSFKDIQAVALASTNEYCVRVSYVVFFLYQAFLQVQFKRSREHLNAKTPFFLNLNLFMYVFKITFLFLCFYVNFS